MLIRTNTVNQNFTVFHSSKNLCKFNAHVFIILCLFQLMIVNAQTDLFYNHKDRASITIPSPFVKLYLTYPQYPFIKD